MKMTELFELIEDLPIDKKKMVEDLVVSLVSEDHVAEGKPKMKFGELKGFVTYIADDFDEPLEDFKDYI